MKWLIAQYSPVTLFSLRMGEATGTGAKTLLVPTPFAIRTALLDVAIRTQGVQTGEDAFQAIKELRLAMLPPKQVVVTNMFAKVLKPQRGDSQKKSAMQRTIAFREYVHLLDNLQIAFGGTETALNVIEPLLLQVNYFGRRGGFFQFMSADEQNTADDEIPQGFVALNGAFINDGDINGRMPVSFASGVIQLMDDWGPKLTYAKVNTHDEAKIKKVGKGLDRVRKSVIFPYRITRTGRGFTAYERIDS